jgi:MFS family permease
MSLSAYTDYVQPLQLIICLGPLYGIGAGMLFAPTINYMSEWFDKKKSLAYGIMCVFKSPAIESRH